MEERWARAQERWTLDAQGWLQDPSPGSEEAPPAVVRLYQESRARLGSGVTSVATVAEAKALKKTSKATFIFRKTNDEAFRAVLRLQVEYEVEVAVKVDGSWKEVQGEAGEASGMQATRAWLMDDGTEGRGGEW